MTTKLIFFLYNFTTLMNDNYIIFIYLGTFSYTIHHIQFIVYTSQITIKLDIRYH